ncbi:MAG: Rne/Rng family ribonuclease [Acidobacteriota bacterium]
MSKELIVNSTSLENRVAIVEDDQITEIFIERQKNKGILGNIYKGRVTKVLPGMQAAFVDIGLERHAFLYVSDFFEDYEEYEELFRSAESAGLEEVIRPEPKSEARPEAAASAEDIKRARRGRRGRREVARERETREQPREQGRETVREASREETREQPREQFREPAREHHREAGRRGREGRFEGAEAGSGEHHIEPLPGESFAHLAAPQLPTVVETQLDHPEDLAIWDPMFEKLNTTEEAKPEPTPQPEKQEAPAPSEPGKPEPGVPPAAPEEAPVRESQLEMKPVAEPVSPPEETKAWSKSKAEEPAEESVPAPTPEPEPAPEPMRRGRGTRKSEQPETELETEPASQAEPAPAERLEGRGRKKAEADAEASVEHKPETQELSARPESNRKRRSAGRTNGRAQIGDLLREGQEILVQIAKEPIGKKGARITSHIALPGRYLVFMPTVDHVGVSRKIASETERQRLKEIIQRLRGDFGKGFIVRTAGENHSEEDFRADMAFLTRTWEDLRAKAERVSAPALVHSEPSLVQRVVRDYFNDGYRAIRVDDEHEYEKIVEFVSRFNPELVNRVRLYNRTEPIFDQYGVTAEIEKALKQKVWLKNGGYIVINQTEALVAIDVNTGKFVGSTNSLEDTITRTNLDAVKEVVRQIRLRDLGGIIVIDFIDMDERRNRQKVMEALQQELSKDKSPSKILQFNEFGLVAITRKRVKQSLERTLCQPCQTCNGTGMTKSVRTICYSIHQEIRKLLPHLQEGEELIIRCHPDVSKALRDGEREVLTEIEDMTRKIVTVKADPLMHVEQFDIVEG